LAYDWEALRTDIKATGLRNSTLTALNAIWNLVSDQ
jgi:ribonucleotide reductase alpha subunit